MLRRLYDVDDPASLTASAFAVAAAGGSAPTTTVNVTPDGVHVVIDGLTFSRRTLRVVGHTTPLTPYGVSARRSTVHRAVLHVAGAKLRGSKVRGYTASCTLGSKVVSTHVAATLGARIVLTGLRADRRYLCTVRATSRAGLGKPARVTVPKTVGKVSYA
jgi:hypothetical protein